MNSNYTTSGNNNHTGAETFGEVHSTPDAPSLTANNYTLQASDCGKTLIMPAGSSGALVTLFNYNGSCTIAIDQAGAVHRDGGQRRDVQLGQRLYQDQGAARDRQPDRRDTLANRTVWVLSGDGA